MNGGTSTSSSRSETSRAPGVAAGSEDGRDVDAGDVDACDGDAGEAGAERSGIACRLSVVVS